MKIKRMEIVKAMKKVCTNNTGSSIIPVYEQALLACNKDKLVISKVNNESEIHVDVAVEDGKDEVMSVDAKVLCGILEKLKSEHVNIEKQDNAVKVFTDKFNATYESFGREDFPSPMASESVLATVDVKVKDFLGILKMSSLSCSAENFNIALKSILLSIKSDKVLSVGTDGKRMSVSEMAGTFSSERDIVLPNMYATIKSVFTDEEQILNIKISEKILEMTAGGIRYVVMLVLIAYPNYSKVIPDYQGWNSLKVKCEELANAMDIVTVKETAHKDVLWEISKDKIEVCKMDTGKKIASYVLSAEYDGSPVKVSLNSDYAKQLFKSYDKDDVEVKIKDGSSPIVFGYDGFKHIIMPLKTK